MQLFVLFCGGLCYVMGVSSASFVGLAFEGTSCAKESDIRLQ